MTSPQPVDQSQNHQHATDEHHSDASQYGQCVQVDVHGRMIVGHSNLLTRPDRDAEQSNGRGVLITHTPGQVA